MRFSHPYGLAFRVIPINRIGTYQSLKKMSRGKGIARLDHTRPRQMRHNLSGRARAAPCPPRSLALPLPICYGNNLEGSTFHQRRKQGKMKHCPECAAAVADDEAFCPGCGLSMFGKPAPVPAPTPAPPPPAPKIKYTSGAKYCPNCKAVGRPTVGGSFLVGGCLLLFFVVPGIIYFVWRWTTGVCPYCGNKTMVPLSQAIYTGAIPPPTK